MPRKLKVYQTSIGFYDLIVAVPSMKAALEAWGAASNLFHQGFAKEADDDAAIDAAIEKPGVVLRRPIGTHKPFSESIDVPDELPSGPPHTQRKAKRAAKHSKGNDAAARRAAAAYEKQRRKDETERKKAEEREAKARERRDAAISQAQLELDDAERAYDEAMEAFEAERNALDKRIEAAEERWADQRVKLNDALKRAKAR